MKSTINDLDTPVDEALGFCSTLYILYVNLDNEYV